MQVGPRLTAMKSFEELYYEAPSFWAAGAVNTQRFDELVELIPASADTLLDVGCGNGAWGHFLMEARPGLTVHGVDRSEVALSRVTFNKQIASIDSLPFQDRSFDIVSCLQVIEHLHAPIAETALDEIARVARKSVIIEVPYDEDIAASRTDCPRCKTRFNIDLHLDSFGHERLLTLLDDRGFRFAKIIYPERKEHLLFVSASLNWLAKLRQPKPHFVSPICPLCGYSEGDRTVMSLKRPDLAVTARPGSRLKGSIKALMNRYWPKTMVTGYAAACLYERIG